MARRNRAAATVENGTQLPVLPRVRIPPIKLASVRDIRGEMRIVYREARSGRLGSLEATRLVVMLRSIVSAFEIETLQERLSALEEQQ